MIFIPGWLISLITFPGIIVHEIAHRFFCDLAKIPVYEVCYFRVGTPSGYVIHAPAPATNLKHAFLISIGPLIVNSFLCMLITFSAAFPARILDDDNTHILFKVLLWLGFSIGMHAFPSNEDIHNFVEKIKEEKQNSVLLLTARLFAGIVKIANLLQVIWFDFFYALCISMTLPWLVCLL